MDAGRGVEEVKRGPGRRGGPGRNSRQGDAAAERAEAGGFQTGRDAVQRGGRVRREPFDGPVGRVGEREVGGDAAGQDGQDAIGQTTDDPFPPGSSAVLGSYREAYEFLPERAG